MLRYNVHVVLVYYNFVYVVCSTRLGIFFLFCGNHLDFCPWDSVVDFQTSVIIHIMRDKTFYDRKPTLKTTLVQHGVISLLVKMCRVGRLRRVLDT